MVDVGGTVCIDAYEASVVELDASGGDVPHAPHLPVTGLRVRAVSRADVLPQAYISQEESRAACAEAGKRLCTDDEWKLACGGANDLTYPYGKDREEGACNDVASVSPMNHYFDAGRVGAAAYTWEKMNDPRLNQLPGGLAKTGSFARCRGAAAIYDMVGNLHEWTATPSTFRGGYYLDVQLHGPGCRYQTTAHLPTYHDYSTGFRCCKLLFAFHQLVKGLVDGLELRRNVRAPRDLARLVERLDRARENVGLRFCRRLALTLERDLPGRVLHRRHVGAGGVVASGALIHVIGGREHVVERLQPGGHPVMMLAMLVLVLSAAAGGA